MRLAVPVCIALSVWLSANPVVLSSQTKYGVTIRALNRGALAKVKTYEWSESQPSLDKSIDSMIVAAVDRELAARGLAKLVSGKADVEVTYRSLSRTDITATKDRKDDTFREFAVGSLVVDLTDPASRQLLFGVRMDTPIERDPATNEATINAAVIAMFEKYPIPPKGSGSRK
jgi:hypothetical protein